jgi:hypothetical protein
MSRDRSVSIVTDCGLDNWSLIVSRNWIFLFITMSGLAVGPHPSAFPIGTRGFFLRDKAGMCLSLVPKLRMLGGLP